MHSSVELGIPELPSSVATAHCESTTTRRKRVPDTYKSNVTRIGLVLMTCCRICNLSASKEVFVAEKVDVDMDGNVQAAALDGAGRVRCE